MSNYETPAAIRFTARIEEDGEVIMDFGVTDRAELEGLVSLLDNGAELVIEKQKNIPGAKNTRIWKTWGMVHKIMKQNDTLFVMADTDFDATKHWVSSDRCIVFTNKVGLTFDSRLVTLYASYNAFVRWGKNGRCRITEGNYIG